MANPIKNQIEALASNPILPTQHKHGNFNTTNRQHPKSVDANLSYIINLFNHFNDHIFETDHIDLLNKYEKIAYLPTDKINTSTARKCHEKKEAILKFLKKAAITPEYKNDLSKIKALKLTLPLDQVLQKIENELPNLDQKQYITIANYVRDLFSTPLPKVTFKMRFVALFSSDQKMLNNTISYIEGERIKCEAIGNKIILSLEAAENIRDNLEDTGLNISHPNQITSLLKNDRNALYEGEEYQKVVENFCRSFPRFRTNCQNFFQQMATLPRISNEKDARSLLTQMIAILEPIEKIDIDQSVISIAFSIYCEEASNRFTPSELAELLYSIISHKYKGGEKPEGNLITLIAESAKFLKSYTKTDSSSEKSEEDGIII